MSVLHRPGCCCNEDADNLSDSSKISHDKLSVCSTTLQWIDMS